MKILVFSFAVSLVLLLDVSAQQSIKPSRVPINPALETKAIAFFERGSECGATDSICRISNYSKAIEIYPDFVEAYNNRGTALQIKGSRDAALKDFTRAVEIEPAFVQGYYNRAVLAAAENDFANALKDFDKAIELSPQLVFAYIGRGNVHLKRRNYRDAIKNFDRALELEPDFAPIYHNRALAYDSIGEAKKAELDRKKSEMLTKAQNASLLDGR
ncbi:MAG: tetratricopeptide repeat protein [Acidobacteriota bacterium]|nr:tetratricopeptide repeat protein [Blastocatellia bacterium]MDQ3491182.1 tetratricopeptide repeat protein [Acidobacteriota bacterium]